MENSEVNFHIWGGGGGELRSRQLPYFQYPSIQVFSIMIVDELLCMGLDGF